MGFCADLQAQGDEADGTHVREAGAPGTSPIPDGGYRRNDPLGLARIGTAPLRWDRREWLAFGTAAGTTALLFAADEGIHDWWQHVVRNGTTDDVADAFEPLGNRRYAVAGSAAAWTAGLVLDSSTMQHTGLLSAQAIVLSSATFETLKVSAHRRRPDGSPDDGHV